MRRLAIAFLAACVGQLVGCGIKGPLTLPSRAPATVAPAATVQPDGRTEALGDSSTAPPTAPPSSSSTHPTFEPAQ